MFYLILSYCLNSMHIYIYIYIHRMYESSTVYQKDFTVSYVDNTYFITL